MCLKEKRTLVIEPSLAYGDLGFGLEIPGGATLRYTIELKEFKDPQSQKQSVPNVFAEMDSDNDLRISRDEMELWFQGHPSRSNEGVPPLFWRREDRDQVKQYRRHRVISIQTNLSLIY